MQQFEKPIRKENVFRNIGVIDSGATEICHDTKLYI